MNYNLAVVIPVYNEAPRIGNVLLSLNKVLSGLPLTSLVIVLNDGSTDGTTRILESFEDNNRFKIINKANTGHGPTVLQGYKIAVTEAEWILQYDGDGEINAEEFPKFWAKREHYEMITGKRVQRKQSLPRYIISTFSRGVVHLLCGKSIHDVNCPFRLMHRHFLTAAIQRIPENTFAPNVIISGIASKISVPVCNLPVNVTNIRKGSLIPSLKILFSSARAFIQTVLYFLQKSRVKHKLFHKDSLRLQRPGPY